MIRSRCLSIRCAVCSVAGALAFVAGLDSSGFTRTWSDASGKFSVDADVVSIKENEVTLKRGDGKLIHLPIDKLSQADQDFLKNAGSVPAGAPTTPIATPAAGSPIAATQSVAPIAASTPKRMNVKQDAKQIAAAEKAINDLYRTEMAGARTPEEKSALASKLIQGDTIEADLDAKYVLARKAAELAASAGNTRMMFTAMGGVESACDDPLPVWIDCLELLLAHNPDDLIPPFEKIDALFSNAVVQENFNAAAKLALMSTAIARFSPDPDQTAIAKLKTGEAAAAKDESRKFALAQTQLKKVPADAAAKAVTGRYLCLVRRDWQQGLPLLNDSNDKILQPIAAAELKPAKTPAELVALGDSWQAAAKKLPLHLAAQDRGLYWHRQALPLSSGIAKIKIEKELAGRELRLGFDLISKLDLETGGAKEQWRVQGHSLLCSSQGGSHAKLEFPTPTEMTHYEISTELSATKPWRVLIFLPLRDRSVAVCLEDAQGFEGLALIDRVPPENSANPTTSRPGSLMPNQSCRVVIDVLIKNSDVEIQVQANKRKIVSWKGPINRLDVNPIWAPPHRDQIGIEVASDGLVIQSFRLIYGKSASPADAANE